MTNFYNRVIKYSLYLLVFLLPLFFLPFSLEAFEYNKQYLLFFLVSFGLFFWIARMVLCDKEIRFKRTPLDIPILVFLFVAILSTVFSVDKISSLLGFYGRFSDSLIGLLSLGMLYFLITNNVSLREKPLITADKLPITTDKKSAKISYKSASISGMLKTFMWSVFFVILISYFSIFGIWAKINSLQVAGYNLQLPAVMTQKTFNPVSGSMEGLAIFLSVVIIFLVGLLLFRIKNYESIIKNVFSYFLLITSLFLLIVIDFIAAWFLLLITLILFVGFSLWKRIFRENVNKLLLPIFLIIIVAVFIGTNIPRNVSMSLPQEQVLDQGISWQIGFRAVTDNVKNGFLGSGLGTFSYNFSKFKPVELNQTQLWQIRFDRAGNHIAEIVGTIGFLGILSYLFLIGFFLLVSWLFLSKNLAGLPLLMMFLALLVGQFVYHQNTVLAFAFWLVLGLSVVSWPPTTFRGKWWGVSFKDFPELSLVFTVLIIILGLAILAMYFFAGKFYLADINYKNAIGEVRLQNLEKSVSLNSWRIEYRIAEARAYLEDALNEMQKEISEQDSIKIQNKVAKTIDEAKIATSISSNRVMAWETLGMIYRDIRTVATGATEWGINSFEKAIALEPANPVLHTELGKLLVLDIPEKAKIEFEKAIELKSDYTDALIQEALIAEREDNLAEVIRRMEDLALNYPFNTEILFQLGRLYFNNNQIDEAISQFNRALILFPNHSNAHYSLGVAYSAKGEIEKAIREFEKVLELNPGNEDVIQKLEELKKSK